MEFIPRGIIAVDKQGDRILFLHPETLDVVGQITDMPILPHELAISPDRRRAYVPAYGDGIHGDNPHPNHVLSVIDLESRQRHADIDLSPLEAPHTGRFGPDGLLFVACESSAAIAVIDGICDHMIGGIPTGSRNSHRLTVLPRRGLICTDNEEDATVSFLSLADDRLLGKVDLPSAIAGIAAAPDESRLYCTDAKQPRLWPIRLDDLQVEPPIALQGHDKGSQVARLSADKRLLMVIGDHEPIVTLLDLASGTQRAVGVGAKPMDSAFHPNHRTALVANEGEGSVAQIDLARAAVLRTVPVGTGCETLAYF